MKPKTLIIAVLVIGAAAAGGYVYWQDQMASRLPDGIITSNGRIEADRINIATKTAGRVLEISVDEGDLVEAGQVVARMDTAELRAMIRRAEAEVRRAERAKAEAASAVLRATSQLDYTRAELARIEQLNKKGYATTQLFDQRRSEFRSADATLSATISGVGQASEAIISAQEELARLNAQLEDANLTSPKHGRIQYRLAEPGEVLGAGGSVLTLLDIGDVYMTVFLPAAEAGPLSIGSEARLVMDPAPEYVIPARVVFVAADAQFTPRSVETAEERAKLMFRVKLRIDPGLLKKHEDRVKTGIRGMAYLRLPQAEPWPEMLQIKLPE